MTEQDKLKKSDWDHIEQPLQPFKRSLIRRCKNCGGEMQAKVEQVENFPHPAREKGILFACDSCKESVWIASNETIIISFSSGLLIGLGIVYMVVNGLFDFVSYSFETGAGSGVLSILLLAIVGLFTYGVFYVVRRGLKLLSVSRQYPIIDAPDQAKSTTIALILGLMPWAIVIGIGFVNFTYFDDNEVLGLLGVAIAVVPIVFASRLGSSMRSVFLATGMWLVIGGSRAWLFDVL